MKKLLLFGAALFAAFTVNAASFQGFDGRDGTLGQQIYDGLIQNQVNITMNETDATAHKYEIILTTGGEECSFTLGGITFWYKNSNDNTIAFKSYGTYIQPNGKERKVVIPTVAGEKVRIYVQDALEGVGVEGVSEGANVNLVAWGENKDLYTELTATGSEIVLWSDKRDDAHTATKFKLGAVLPADGTGLVNLEGENAVKDGKFMQNGQIYIRKNGKVFNILGAQVAE
ncbi:MAG: hypothetical protein IKN91_01400 [Paludibacteraceae bacterium]|nr:hypothetical protein [Paludibacteraceae bacterium]